VRAPANGWFEGVKIRDTTFVLNDDLAVDDGRAAVELSCCLDYAGVTLAPIEAIAGISACFAALDTEERAVAVMLDFVNPARTWRSTVIEPKSPGVGTRRVCGEVWGAESGTDRLVVIRTGEKQAKD
jgi:hypothetical protein